MHQLRTLRSIRSLRGKRVLVRCDLNVSTSASGKLTSTDLWKLRGVLPTLAYLRRKGARTIAVSHRGRPHGHDHDLSMRPVVQKLAELMKTSVDFWHGSIEDYEARSRSLKNGRIACLENIRFFKEENANDPIFGKKLAALCDIYVDDAFGNVHRQHASMVAVTRYHPAYAGFLMEYEVAHLAGLLERATGPIVAIIGGNKISSKIRLIKKLLRKVDWILLGGALANTVLAAMDYKIGRSVYEEDMRTWSRSILHNKLKVPLDARVAHTMQSRTSRIASIGAVYNKDMILDIGPETVDFYGQIIAHAKTVIWNGPLGYFEDPRFARGTKDLVEILTKAKAKSYVGGGETVKAVLAAGAEHKVHFISSGGGAMLALLEGRPLPALRAMYKR